MVLNTPVHAVDRQQALTLCRAYMFEDRLHQIATTNPEFVMTAQRDDVFRQALLQADLCIPDGIGLIYASRWMGCPLPARVAGSELIIDLCRMAAGEGWRPFFLGAGPGVAERTAEIMQGRFPALQVAGVFGGTPLLRHNDDILSRVNDSGANMLFVAYGAPQQDKWIARNKERMPAVRLAMGVGGAFDFIGGRAQRAPLWMQRSGLEWLHRLLREPWRWRRMMALPHFALKVLLTSRP